MWLSVPDILAIHYLTGAYSKYLARSSADTSLVNWRTRRASSGDSDPVPQLGVMIVCLNNAALSQLSPESWAACSSQRLTRG